MTLNSANLDWLAADITDNPSDVSPNIIFKRLLNQGLTIFGTKNQVKKGRRIAMSHVEVSLLVRFFIRLTIQSFHDNTFYKRHSARIRETTKVAPATP
jgi:hypothetical protein